MAFLDGIKGKISMASYREIKCFCCIWIMAVVLMTGCNRGENSQKESTDNIETKQETENDTESSNLYIEIRKDKEMYGTYLLSENQVIKIGETNVCEIKDNKCKMIKATCPKQICTNQKAIYKKGQSIICLPNKVVIEVKETDNMR